MLHFKLSSTKKVSLFWKGKKINLSFNRQLNAASKPDLVMYVLIMRWVFIYYGLAFVFTSHMKAHRIIRHSAVAILKARLEVSLRISFD